MKASVVSLFVGIVAASVNTTSGAGIEFTGMFSIPDSSALCGVFLVGLVALRRFRNSPRRITITALVLGVLNFLGSAQSLASLATDLFPTGVDDSGIVLADGQPDPHYQIVEASAGPLPLQPVTVNSFSFPLPSPWVPNDATGSRGSKWIARTADAVSLNLGDIYIYRTTFTLPEGVSPDSVEISGIWGTDDYGRAMLLNGVPTGDTHLLATQSPGFTMLVQFLVTKGFKSGENILDFVVTDDGGAVTGLRVHTIQLQQKHQPLPAGYNLAADFSVSQNPNGVWSYGWSESRGAAFELDTVTGEDTRYGDLIGWVPPNFGDAFPYIAYAAASYYHPTFSVPKGTINVHPGPNGQNSVIRWTAPAAGAYELTGFFSGNDFAYPTTTDIAILQGTTEIFSGDINSYRGSGLPFVLIEQVNVGDTIDFTVGYGADGNFFGDSTALDVTIRPPLTGAQGDFNFDGCIDGTDLAFLMNQVRTRSTNLAYDLNGDGKVDIADARFLVLHFTNPGGLPCNSLNSP